VSGMSNLCQERKKISKLGIYYHFLVQIWRLELSTRDNMCLYDIETVQPVTWNWRFQTRRLTHKQTTWSSYN